jgi:hypothetical protein
MPDLREQKQKQEQEEKRGERVEYKGPGDWPGDNNVLPNNEPADSEDLPDDVARDLKNEGIAQDPSDKPIP